MDSGCRKALSIASESASQVSTTLAFPYLAMVSEKAS